MTVLPTATATDPARDLSVPRELDLPTIVAGASDAELDIAKIFAAPTDPVDRELWRQRLSAWRDRRRGQLDGVSRQDWAAQCRTVFLSWIYDERLYDRDHDRFTPDRLLAELGREYGGIDAIVLWHAYPVIGLDDRNQFDFYDVPGLRELVDTLHRSGIRVFLDYNPWDVSTSRAAQPDPPMLRTLLDRLDADGLFLDTLREGGADLLAALDPRCVLEGESRVSIAAMRTHQLSWAQWFADSDVPGVLRAHWLDRSHQQHHVRRWNRDHSTELQSAHLNGCGVLLWDSVFGVWVGWNDRDRATHRRIRSIQTAFADLLTTGSWTPLPDLGPAAEAQRVFGSRFADKSRQLYLLVNRGDRDATVPLPFEATDLFSESLRPSRSAQVPARGVGAVLVGDPGRWRFQSYETGCSSAFPDRPLIRLAARQQLSPVRRCQATAVDLPAGLHHWTMRFRRRENGLLAGAWWVDAWKPLPPDLHAPMEQDMLVTVEGGARVRVAPVTCAEFGEFLVDTGYSPGCAHRFVSHDRLLQHPTETVTLVDVDDATAFAAWAGGRLPTAAEWHLAAGSDPPVDIWQWTADRYLEGQSRFTLLVGGNPRALAGSDWYFDSGARPLGWVAKLTEPGRGLARSDRLGFGLAWGPESVALPGDTRIGSDSAAVRAAAAT